MVGYYNWQRLEFDEERDLKYYKCWFLMSHVCVPALKPFDLWLWPGLCQRRLPEGADRIGTPAVIPNDMRIKDGYWYASPIILSEEEARKREPKFRHKMTSWIKDAEKMYRQYIAQMMATCAGNCSE